VTLKRVEDCQHSIQPHWVPCEVRPVFSIQVQIVNLIRPSVTALLLKLPIVNSRIPGV
jgi:hypothetical protein